MMIHFPRPRRPQRSRSDMAVRPQLQRRLSVGDMTEIEVASEADEDSLSGKIVSCPVICDSLSGKIVSCPVICLCEMFSHQKRTVGCFR